MDHRERVLIALAHQEPDRVPLALWGSAYGVTDGLYHNWLRELGWEPLSPFRRRGGHTVNCYDDRILDLVDADIRHVWLGSTDLASPPAEGGVDAWGVPWRKVGGYLFAGDPPLAQAEVEDMESYPWPQVASLVRKEELRERARYLRDKTDYAVAARAVASYGPFEQACQLRGTEQFMIDLLTDEDFAVALIDKIVDVLHRWLEIYLDIISADVDIMELPGDDYASQMAPLISPRLFDKYFKPHWQRLINLVKQASSQIYVLFHSDGAIAPFIPALLEAGVDVLHPLEPVPATDVVAVKREYGHQISFLGGIDIKQAMTGSEEEVVAEVRRRIGLLAEGGGYILAPSNHLQADVPAENVIALFRAALKYGKYPYIHTFSLPDSISIEEGKMHKITMLGTGLIGMFYTMTLHGRRGGDRAHVVYSRSEDSAKSFAAEWGVPKWTTDMAEAINDPETDVVVVGLPNFVHQDAVIMAAEAGKAVLCTKPLGRNAAEAKAMLDAVEKAGVFHGYLEDLVYTPKMLKSVQFVKDGAVGKVLWVRSRETHGGPHSAWFWDVELAGGGAIVDMGCHCIEIARNFVGKDNRPVEVMCWADTLVHPIEAEDHGIGLIRFESGAIGQFEVSWAFRGGMDLRDEVSGTEGTIWIDHFLRTGLELFTAVGPRGYVAEKAEGATGWLFPVGDEVHELGYPDMFNDMLNALDNDEEPMETFYDGYVVNAIMDACYRSAKSKRWEPVELEVWRGASLPVEEKAPVEYGDKFVVIKQERMPDGQTKLILRDKETNRIIQKVVSGEG